MVFFGDEENPKTGLCFCFNCLKRMTTEDGKGFGYCEKDKLTYGEYIYKNEDGYYYTG